MDYSLKLQRLQYLYGLTEKYTLLMYQSTDERERLYRELCEVYGEVSDAFDEVGGKQRIDVENAGGGGRSTYPNYFEAGFLSGRSFHTHQGKTELLKVIGKIKQKVDGSGSRSVSKGDPWPLMHNTVINAAQNRFESGQYADAAEAAMKAVNARVKKVWIASGQEEKDGKQLMLGAFSVNKPVVRLADLSTESGRNIQEGYMHLFAGAMQGIRNPKAHDNLTIPPERCLHFLVLASLLMSKLDEAAVA